MIRRQEEGGGRKRGLEEHVSGGRKEGRKEEPEEGHGRRRWKRKKTIMKSIGKEMSVKR